MDEEGSWCGRSLDGGANVTLENSTGNWNNLMTGITAGTYTVKFYCNDTTGLMNTTNVTFTKSPTVSISLTNFPINFGDIIIGQTNDTTDNSPLPFVIQNDGDVSVNVTVEAGNLWSTATNPTSNYQFMCGATGEASCASGSVISFTNIPASGNPTTVIAFLNYVEASDTNEVEIKITSPSEEPSGSKSSIAIFIASQA